MPKKYSKNVGIFYKLRDISQLNTLKCLYHSFIESYINYCPLIYGNAYASHLKPLEILQKKCIRVISFSPPFTHTDLLFKELKLLKLHDKNREKFKINKFHMFTRLDNSYSFIYS